MTPRASQISPAQPGEVLKHINALDGVRGVAILSVLVYHLLWSSSNTGSILLTVFAGVRTAGWIGVDIFFVLSGFLITGILYQSLDDAHYFRNFYARRMFRIFPLYYGVLLVVLAVYPFLHMATATNLRQLGFIALYLQNIPPVLHLPGPTFLGHLWSLAVEEQFYLVWPVLVFLVRDRVRLMWLSVFLALLAPLFRVVLLHHGAGDDVYFYTFCRQDSLLCGAWLALATRGPSRETIIRRAWIPLVASLAILAFIVWKTRSFSHEGNYDLNSYGYTVIAIGAGGFIAMCLRDKSLAKSLMSLKFLRFFGKYSYGLYVLHTIVEHAIVNPLERSAIAPTLHSRLLYHLLHFFASLSLATLTAFLSFRYYEQPFLRMKRFFNYAHSKGSAEQRKEVVA